MGENGKGQGVKSKIMGNIHRNQAADWLYILRDNGGEESKKQKKRAKIQV